MVELYEKGTADQKKRKDRTKDEMEVEAQKIFCNKIKKSNLKQ